MPLALPIRVMRQRWSAAIATAMTLRAMAMVTRTTRTKVPPLHLLDLHFRPASPHSLHPFPSLQPPLERVPPRLPPAPPHNGPSFGKRSPLVSPSRVIGSQRWRRRSSRLLCGSAAPLMAASGSSSSSATTKERRVGTKRAAPMQLIRPSSLSISPALLLRLRARRRVNHPSRKQRRPSFRRRHSSPTRPYRTGRPFTLTPPSASAAAKRRRVTLQLSSRHASCGQASALEVTCLPHRRRFIVPRRHHCRMITFISEAALLHSLLLSATPTNSNNSSRARSRPPRRTAATGSRPTTPARARIRTSGLKTSATLSRLTFLTL